MNWQMRHEGSPEVTKGLTPAQIVHGLHEGIWDPSDEVRGPNDVKWQALESHPFFAEALADYEPVKVHRDDKEEHLDMNPLIDVALVLLIFFILTTTYDAIRKVLDMPTAGKKQQGPREIPPEKVKSEFVLVKASREIDEAGKVGAVKYVVDGQEVAEHHLTDAISSGFAQGKRQMIIDANNVTWETVVTLIDAGKNGRMTKILMKADRRE